MNENWKYIDNKSFIVESRDYENGIFYFAWVNPDGSVFGFEHLPPNNPHTTITYFKNMQDFVNRVDWLPHVRRGIKDDELRRMVDKKTNIKRRNNG